MDRLNQLVWPTSVALIGLVQLGIPRVTRPEVMVMVGVKVRLSGLVAAAVLGQTVSYAAGPSSIREARLGGFDGLPGGAVLQGGPFAILLGTAVWVFVHWERLPSQIPVHWGLGGFANGWVGRGPRIFALVAAGAALCGFLALMAYAVSSRTRQVRVAGAAGLAEQRFRTMILWTLLGAEYLVACTLSFPLIFAMVGLFAIPLAIVGLGGLG